jgi:hypothetical protein
MSWLGSLEDRVSRLQVGKREREHLDSQLAHAQLSVHNSAHYKPPSYRRPAHGSTLSYVRQQLHGKLKRGYNSTCSIKENKIKVP